ncbi:16236_t:CDS:2, partial [Dentiscutata erythropus]
ALTALAQKILNNISSINRSKQTLTVVSVPAVAEKIAAVLKRVANVNSLITTHYILYCKALLFV